MLSLRAVTTRMMVGTRMVPPRNFCRASEAWDLLLTADDIEDESAFIKNRMQEHKATATFVIETAVQNIANRSKAGYEQLRHIRMAELDFASAVAPLFKNIKSVQIATYVWEDLLENGIASIEHCNHMLKLASDWKLKHTAFSIIKKMQQHDIEPNHLSHSFVISAIGRSRPNSHKEALAYFNGLVDRGFTPNDKIYMSLLTACKTHESIELAKTIFKTYLQDVEVRKVVMPFNAMIGLTARHGQMDFAIRLLRNLDSFGVTVSASSFSMVITTILDKHFDDIDMLQEAEQLFYLMVRMEIPPPLQTIQAAVDIGKLLKSSLLLESALELMDAVRDVE